MIMNQAVADTIRAVYAEYPELQFSNDDDRRLLVRRAAQQIVFKTKDTNWGVKSRGNTAPQGKDSIAYRTGPSSMDIWDIQNGSTGQLQINSDPSFPNVTDQMFIPVEPVNWLGSDSPTIPIPTNPPSNPPQDILELKAKLDDLSNKLDTLAQIMTIQNSKINQVIGIDTQILAKPDQAVRFPDYIGSTWLGTIVLKPR